MAIRHRAVLAEDKHERREAILDAAERLLCRAPERVANVAEVADEAGLAKGTVYLYFRSKEELLLALHERHVDGYFGALRDLVERAQPLTLDAMLELTRAHMVDRPAFLPLAARCFGIMRTGVPQQTADAFKERMAGKLGAAGAALERQFPGLPAGRGLALLRHAYAMIIGLWQMSSSAGTGTSTTDACGTPAFDYPGELARGLTALWHGSIARIAAAAPHPRKE